MVTVDNKQRPRDVWAVIRQGTRGAATYISDSGIARRQFLMDGLMPIRRIVPQIPLKSTA
jgi:hypothetical protein